MTSRIFRDHGLGVGLRPQHQALFKTRPPQSIQWVEALTENYLAWDQLPRPKSRRNLLEIRKNIPVALHGVSLSVGTAGTADLKALKELADQVEPLWISDHLCWTSHSRTPGIHENFHDLLPLPYTREAVHTVVENVSRAQDFLKQRILLENVSSYIEFASSEMTEWEFLAEIARRADCGILLDINNVYVNSVNHGFDPIRYLQSLPSERIGQIHLAGHSVKDGYLIDTHDAPVCDEVWELFRWATRHFGLISTMIEWDSKIPEFSVLEDELKKADKIRNPPSLAEIQSRFAAILKKPALDEQDIKELLITSKAESPATPETRLGIYRYAYFARIEESLAADFPKLKIALGDEPFEELIRKYLKAYPSQYSSLAQVGKNLSKFLSETAPYSTQSELNELATEEWAHCLCQWSESGISADFSKLLELSEEEKLNQVLLLAPSAQFIKTSSSFVLFKVHHEVKRLELTPSMEKLLGEIRTGRSLGELVTLLENSEEPATVATSTDAAALDAALSRRAKPATPMMMTWISNWVAAGLITGFRAT